MDVAKEWVCEVLRLAQSGEGIALWEGRALFIPGVFPGERILARRTSHPQRAELVQIREASPARRAPPCPHFEHCGGCDWMALEEAQQREFKQSLMVSNLERMGGIPEGSYALYPMAFNQNLWGYRRRARLGRAGRRLGFRLRSSAACTPLEFCPLLVPALQHLPGAFCEAWGEGAMGELEELELLEGQGEVALGLRLNCKLQDRHMRLAQRVRRGLNIAGLWLQGRGGAVGKEEGRVYLRDWGFAYMHPAVFAQSNGAMNIQLLRTLRAWMQALVEDIGHASVLELFCGNGNFTWAISRLVRELWAIEANPLAIHLAQKMGAEKARTLQSLNAPGHPPPNAAMRFIVGDVARVVQGLIKEAKRFNCMVADPPRQGAPGIGRWAQQLGVQYVFYISCNPSSLARDAAELQREGFAPLRLQLFDFFPQTHHAESLMVFAKTKDPLPPQHPSPPP